jgi:hypothetical protein
MSLLKRDKYIPSLSWGFNPGSYYRSQSFKDAFGSLTLGGYDASRSYTPSLAVDFGPDDGRELVVGVQRISLNQVSADDGSPSHIDLTVDPFLAALDSTQPSIWLPNATCMVFAETFGLFWNDAAQLFLVNDSQHTNLLSKNITTVFTLGNTVTGGETVDITLPYGSFDLLATYPLTSTTMRYFPLKCTKNTTAVSWFSCLWSSISRNSQHMLTYGTETVHSRSKLFARSVHNSRL